QQNCLQAKDHSVKKDARIIIKAEKMSTQLSPEEEESVEGKEIAVCDDIQENFKPDCYNIVGKIISNKEINFKATKAALLGMWGNTKDLSILEAGEEYVHSKLKWTE
ncbi:hypothetical protein PIB30_100110, partial [Stylosanthes scabra]|nr:hypothetical protein [Stylosanthes scabra]